MAVAAQRKENGEGEVEDEVSYMRCPVSLVVIDPDVMVPNQQVKCAITEFLKNNPWAFRFDPREKFENIQVWV